VSREPNNVSIIFDSGAFGGTRDTRRGEPRERLKLIKAVIKAARVGGPGPEDDRSNHYLVSGNRAKWRDKERISTTTPVPERASKPKRRQEMENRCQRCLPKYSIMNGWWALCGPLVAGRSCRVAFPVPCSLGDVGAVACCDICDRKDLEEKAARIDSVELAASNSLPVEQWYQQLVAGSTKQEIRASVLDPHLVCVHKVPCMSEPAIDS
jgi:hypothetical protein